MKEENSFQKKWKNGMAVFSYFIPIIITILIKVPITMSIYDLILTKATYFFSISAILCPILLILDHKTRSRLPLLKRKKWKTSLMGYLILFFFFSISAIGAFQLHSENYKYYFKEYLNIEKTKENSSISKNELEEQLTNLSEEEPVEQRTNTINLTRLKIHYLDVGQGDAIFLELPNQETMLIDAGESEQSSKIIQYIKKLGYSKIDYIVATHPHADHIGGLSKVLEEFEIKSIYMPKVVTTSKTYENLLKTIQKKNLKIKKAFSDVKIIDQENYKMEFVAPTKTTYQQLNNYSAVIKLIWNEHTFLFMGDAEIDSEKEITQNIKADVIKIGHHGSDTSTSEDFLKKVKPSYAIISVGNENLYNHPNEMILKRLNNIGAKVLQTNELGTIIVTSDGKNILVDTQRELEEKKKVEEKITFNNKIELVEISNPIKKGEQASITIKGMPNTTYHITVQYQNKSNAKGLEPKVSDQFGSVTWRWKIGTNIKSGTYQIIISDENQNEIYDFKVE